MTPETLTALRGSIVKWRGIVAGTTEDMGTENCPLCALFYGDHGTCVGCPVSEATSATCCGGTPYDRWSDYWAPSAESNWDLKHVPLEQLDEIRALAQAELDFLISLLPKGETP